MVFTHSYVVVTLEVVVWVVSHDFILTKLSAPKWVLPDICSHKLYPTFALKKVSIFLVLKCLNCKLKLI